MLQPSVVGEEHYKTARAVQSTLQRYKELQDIIAILGLDELPEQAFYLVGNIDEVKAKAEKIKTEK